MKRTASAEWRGNLRDGRGKLTSESGTLSNTPYSYRMRFENQVGTNPEELIAAAHAGCFSMALSGELQKSGFIPESIHSDATVSLEQIDGEWSITEIQIAVSARVPGIDSSRFARAAEAAKLGCPVSRALKARIELDAKLLPSGGGESVLFDLKKASGA